MSTKRLLVIVGPTGSGKTDLSIRLASHYAAPILSTDSRQVYRGMPIGTAQPTFDQLQAVEHHFIASHDIKDYLSCGEYEVQALARLEKLFAGHDYVVAVGGAGLYVRALCEGMDDLPQADESLREEMDRWLAEEGLGALAEKLRELAPEYYRIVDLNNPARVVRALEVCLQTGMPREELYDRINRRVDRMLADGLEAEARALYPYRELNALQTVGYREFFDYFDGRIGYDEAVELIKRNSRRYAKRQLTWFRRDPEIRWFRPDDDAAMINYIDFGKS